MKFNQPYGKFRDWALRHHLGRKLLFICVLGSIVSVVITSIMLKNTPNLSMSRNLLTFLLIDFVFLMIFIAVIAKSVASLWAERKSDQAGSMLHSRIVAIFSLLAIVPTILVAGCSVLFF
ncbi:hypothetical protein QM565_14655 [Geitlerinema splendidum]|nr:hypothetical protein [Geitlerinema splendidum]